MMEGFSCLQPTLMFVSPVKPGVVNPRTQKCLYTWKVLYHVLSRCHSKRTADVPVPIAQSKDAYVRVFFAVLLVSQCML